MPEKHEKEIAISVIIPNYNAQDTLKKCLEGIFSSDFGNFEVIVADDASTDGSLTIAEQFQVKILKSTADVPQGAAHARNRAAQVASGKIFFFTDADVVIQKDTLGRIAKIFSDNNDIHAVIGSYTNKTPINTFPSQFKNYLHHFTHQLSSEDAITFWTACGAIYADVFNRIEGFNETYEAATVEDIAFGYKLTKHGYSILLKKDLQVTHLKYYTFFSLIKSDVFNRAVPWTRLMLREKTFRSDLNTSFSSAFGLVIAYLMLPLFIIVPFNHSIAFLLVIFSLVFIFLNRGLYKLIYHDAGLLFTIKFVMMSYIYYIYSGVGLMIAIIGFCCGKSY